MAGDREYILPVDAALEEPEGQQLPASEVDSLEGDGRIDVLPDFQALPA